MANAAKEHLYINGVIFEDDVDFPVKKKSRSLRRKRDVTKAIRKRGISRSVYGHDWYSNLHEYSKNKIHCSCPMCRFRSIYDPDNKPISDRRNLIGMDQRRMLWDIEDETA